MTNEEAYNKLLAERPVIVSVMLRDKHRYHYPESLADAIAASSDPPELVSLILQSAKHIYQGGLTKRVADLCEKCGSPWESWDEIAAPDVCSICGTSR